MVSPHPVYSPRGTPISVFNRCVALGALGHEVDLVTYPIGDDRPAPGLRYLRASMPGVKSVAVGPSYQKALLNGAVTVRSFAHAARSRRAYDVVHTHEEAGLFGPALARVVDAPHVYDMGNDWADVLNNYGLSTHHPATRTAAVLENAVINHSAAVIAHFPSISEHVRSVGSTPVETVCNISLEADATTTVAEEIRRLWAPDHEPVVLYTGTLEPYQGVELLVGAMVSVRQSHPDAVLVIVGGRQDQRDALQKLAADIGVAHRVRLFGPVPSPLVPSALAAADILVSPRETGSNTPLKIFSYLRSGRPIVATSITSHTQVLDGESCVLVEPTAPGIGAGIASLLDPGPARERAVAGASSLRAHYGIEQFVGGVAMAYSNVGAGVPDASKIRRAAELIESAARADAERVVESVGVRESFGEPSLSVRPQPVPRSIT
jgi:glycosyltransferase involved in cell wall biosynthesis